MSEPGKKYDEWVVTDNREEVTEPPLYKVILHNDDYTTMDFVVMILETVFHKSHQEATVIMLNVHQHGRGIAGVYTRDIAETKATQVKNMARRNDYPLRCTFEKA